MSPDPNPQVPMVERRRRLIMRWVCVANSESAGARCSTRIIARWIPVLAAVAVAVSGTVFATIPVVVPLREATRPVSLWFARTHSADPDGHRFAAGSPF